MKRNPLTFTSTSDAIIKFTVSDRDVYKCQKNEKHAITDIYYRIFKGRCFPDWRLCVFKESDLNGQDSAARIYESHFILEAGDKLQLESKGMVYSPKFSILNAGISMVKASGNIMSLMNYSDTVPYGGFRRTFVNCINLYSAPELPATNLSDCCYQEMFSGCTNLQAAPELPATKLADACYMEMFQKCTWMKKAPKILPAKTLKAWCYAYMFYGCYDLKAAPMLLATKLADRCYYRMFYGCPDVTNIKLPRVIITGAADHMNEATTLTPNYSIIPSSSLSKREYKVYSDFQFTF